MMKAVLSLNDDTKARLLLIVFVTVAFLRFWDGHSADLMASWLAGHYLSAGQPDAVYSGITNSFTLTPHPEWVALLEGTAYSGPVYPFIYPPLWAWLMGPLPTLEDFWVFMVLMTAVNAILMAAIIELARKAANTDVPHSLWVLTGILAFSMTSIGNVSMMENQPHILVSFLIVLAIERSRAGAQTTAGIALALAASLKLVPAVFALAFLVLGQRRAFASFTVSGAFLGGASIAVAGWPLHTVFLAELRGISDTILVTAMSFNIHSSIAQLFFADLLIEADVTLIGAEAREIGDGDFFYLQAGPVAILFARFTLLACVGWCLWLLRRSDDDTRYGLVWPLMIALTAVTSPLSWVYYFIPAIAFLPVLYDRFGFREGRFLICLIIVPLTGPVVGAYVDLDLLPDSYQLIGTLAMISMTAAFIVAMGRAPSRARNADQSGQRGDTAERSGSGDHARSPDHATIPSALAAE